MPPAVPLFDIQTLMDWAQIPDTVDQNVLTRCIQAASDMAEAEVGRVIVQPVAAITEFYSGDRTSPSIGGRYGETLYLRNAPVTITSVSENGVALTVASAGYDISKDVRADLSNGLLIRLTTGQTLPIISPWYANTRGWAAGQANITVVYKPGVAVDQVPANVVQAAIEIAYAIYQESQRSGYSSVSRGGKNASFLRGLSMLAQEGLESYKQWRPK